MSTQGYEYQKVRDLLMPEMRKCRNKDVRMKVEMLLLGLKVKSVVLACKRLGVGRSTYYKWWKRLLNGNFKIKALEEKSRRPKRSPKRIAMSLEKRILYYRKRATEP